MAEKSQLQTQTSSRAVATLRAICAQNQIGVLFLDRKGLVLDANEAATTMLLENGNALEGRPFLSLVSGLSTTQEQNFVHFLDGKQNGCRLEAQVAKKAETPLWLRITTELIEEPQTENLSSVALVEDISEKRGLEERLERQALYDSLTNLPNRELFVDRVAHAMKRTRRDQSYTFAVLYIDADRFKKINDSLGRESGDQILIDLAKRLEKSVRPGDTICRLGGDEFTILLEGIHSVTDATRVAERIQQELLSPSKIGDQEVLLTVSIGIVRSSPGYENPEELIRNADSAMLRAKELGAGRHQLFDAEMHSHVQSILSLEQDLRRALERKETWIAYQPIICLKSGKMKGLEALARWTHSERGMVSPGDFIPLAEDSGVILSLGHWVLGEACRQMNIWRDDHADYVPLNLSVNVSGKQFADPTLVDQVKALLAESGLNPNALSLEITESVIMEKSDDATSALARLQDLGIRLHMDDFGTGYSSLAYLHRFPMDALKIDRSFIMRMDQGGRTIELVRTIINLARTLKLSVVAEGVETEKHLETLRALGCDYAQGYFFSKPLNSKEMSSFIAEHPQW